MVPSREEFGYILMVWGAGLIVMGVSLIIGAGVGTLAGF